MAFRVNDHGGKVLFYERRAHSLDGRMNLRMKLNQVGIDQQPDGGLVGEQKRERDNRDLSVSAFSVCRCFWSLRVLGRGAFRFRRFRFHQWGVFRRAIS